LFLSVWPWRLQPVPVAILALTVLAVLAAVTGRRPRLPLPSLADLVTVCAAVGVAGYLARPYLRSDFAGRLGYAMNGEDLLLRVALLARPAAGGRAQILVVASLLVALGFTYYLFLPGLALAAAVSVLRHRRPFALVTGLVGAGFALTPPVIGVLAGGQAAAVNASGGLRNSRDALLALALLVAAALASAAGRRSPVWRAYRWPLA